MVIIYTQREQEVRLGILVSTLPWMAQSFRTEHCADIAAGIVVVVACETVVVGPSVVVGSSVVVDSSVVVGSSVVFVVNISA